MHRSRGLRSTQSAGGFTAVALRVAILIFSIGPVRTVHGQHRPAGAVPPAILVGRNMQVSIDRRNDPHMEFVAAADPESNARVVACAMVWDRTHGTWIDALYASTDGGMRWHVAGVDSTRASDSYTADPACTFGPGGEVFFAVLPADGKGIHLYRSVDDGRTWTRPTTTLPMLDREYVTVDSGGMVYLYAIGAIDPSQSAGEGPQVQILTSRASSDFGRPLHLPVDSVPASAIAGPGAVSTDGRLLIPVVATYASRGGGGIGSQRVEMIAVERDTAITRVAIAAGTGMTLNEIPGLAVDRSRGPYRGRTYVVWTDSIACRRAVLLASSSDSGKTWSDPLAVDDNGCNGAPATRDPFFAAIAVSPTGVVGVSWYDRRESAHAAHVHMRFTASIDGGDSFLPSVAVSQRGYDLEAPMQVYPLTISTQRTANGRQLVASIHAGDHTYPGPVAGSVNRENFGDTQGLAVGHDGVFHVFWLDNRTEISQLWTAGVQVSGAPVGKVPAALSRLTDVTGEVRVVFSDIHFDPKRRTLSLGARVTNTSHRTFTGPLRLYTTRLNAEYMGPVCASTAIDVAGRRGDCKRSAQWVLEGLMPDTGLVPEATTGEKRLRFWYPRYDPARGWPSVAFTSRVFAQWREGSAAQ